MTAEARRLLSRLEASGVELWAEGSRLRYRAPQGTLTAELRAELARHKATLLDVLRNGEGAGEAFALPRVPAREQGPGSSIHVELYRRRFRADAAKTALLDVCPPWIRYVNPVLGYMLQQVNMDKEFVRGEGTRLYDAEGNEYLDFVAQYGALPFGHNPDEVWDALDELRRQRRPGFVNLSVLGPAGELAEKLLDVAPAGMRYVTFGNSGAEAVEAAIKLARSATGRPGILSTVNGFHGKTLGALSATGKRAYQAAFNAPAQDFFYVPYGDAGALERALAARPAAFAAFIVEPIQGEGGVVEPPPGYLAEAASICRARGTLVIVDEVQTGLGRTGAMFACDHEGVAPDIVTVAKALGGGILPIGACLCTESVYNEEFATQHTSTFGGNAPACRAGLAVLDLLTRNDRALVRAAAETGAYLKEGLDRLREAHPRVLRSVRGRGLLLGIEFHLESELFARGLMRYMADQEVFSYAVAAHLLNVHHLRLAPTLSAPAVIRIEPPLTVNRSECDRLLEGLACTLEPLERGDVAPILAHLVGADLTDRRSTVRVGEHATAVRTPAPPRPGVREGRFGFVTHLGEEDTWASLDPGLEIFTDAEMAGLKKRVSDLLDPVPVGEVLIGSSEGEAARGEFVMLPFSAREVIGMSYERAVAEVRYAVQLCARRGARIVGLGGFNSIVTQGGLAIAGECDVALTTGNSYTAVAGVQALEIACRHRAMAMPPLVATVVGATGALGKATASLLAERVGKLVLVGNPAHEKRSRSRLLDVAAGIVEALWRGLEEERRFSEGTLGHRLAAVRAALGPEMGREGFERIARDFVDHQKCILLSVDSRTAPRESRLVVTATSSVEPLFEASSFASDAIVCELSRPFNVDGAIRRERPDVWVIEGGIVRVPGEPDLGLRNGLSPGQTFACVAETMMLALEGCYEDTSLGVDLPLETLHRMERLADRHGFETVVPGPSARRDRNRSGAGELFMR